MDFHLIGVPGICWHCPAPRWCCRATSCRRSTVAAVFGFLVVGQLVSNYFNGQFGVLLGAIVAGLMLFGLDHIRHFAGRIAHAAMPSVSPTPEYLAYRKLEVYRGGAGRRDPRGNGGAGAGGGGALDLQERGVASISRNSPSCSQIGNKLRVFAKIACLRRLSSAIRVIDSRCQRLSQPQLARSPTARSAPSSWRRTGARSRDPNAAGPWSGCCGC